jgi:hypothetical protein
MYVAIKVFAVGICFVFERIILKIFRYHKQEKHLNVKKIAYFAQNEKKSLKALIQFLTYLNLS